MILGIDAGGFKTKIVGPHGVDSFYSTIGPYKESQFDTQYGSDDMVFELEDGRKGRAGTAAMFESKLSTSMKGESKFHQDAKLRVLLAIHRYLDKNREDRKFSIVVGQPISRYKAEKADIKKMLEGKHSIVVNEVKREFTIEHVGVSPEGAAVGLLKVQPETWVRVVDAGSGTINFATLFGPKFVDNGSDTLAFGMETADGSDADVARKIASELITANWPTDAAVDLVGGGATKLQEHLQKQFRNTEIYKPRFDGKDLDPEFANALAFYEIARKLYG